MTRLTLAHLDSLVGPEVFFAPKRWVDAVKFAQERLREVRAALRSSSDGAFRLDPADLVSAQRLQDYTESFCDSCDGDLAELHTLSLMCAKGRPGNNYYSSEALLVRRAITRRVHDLLERRPELLHRNVHVASGASSTMPVLQFLIRSSVNLDPARLTAQARMPGLPGELLFQALRAGRTADTPLLLAALDPSRMNCCGSAMAILQADDRALSEMDGFVFLQALWRATAQYATGDAWQLESAMRLLELIRLRQDQAEGDDSRFGWGNPRELLEVTDMRWASAAGLHPVTGLIYSIAIASSSVGRPDYSSVENFPDVPLRQLTDALNGILKPEARLELESLGAANLLKLIIACPHANNVSTPQIFWQMPIFGRGVNTVYDMVNWAADFPCETSELHALLETTQALESEFRSVMGDSHYGALKARITHRLMSHAIADTPVGAQPATPAPSPSRRLRAV